MDCIGLYWLALVHVSFVRRCQEQKRNSGVNWREWTCWRNLYSPNPRYTMSSYAFLRLYVPNMSSFTLHMVSQLIWKALPHWQARKRHLLRSSWVASVVRFPPCDIKPLPSIQHVIIYFPKALRRVLPENPLNTETSTLTLRHLHLHTHTHTHWKSESIQVQSMQVSKYASLMMSMQACNEYASMQWVCKCDEWTWKTSMEN